MAEALGKLGEEFLNTGGDSEKLRQGLQEIDSSGNFDEAIDGTEALSSKLNVAGNEAVDTRDKAKEIRIESEQFQGLEAAIELLGGLKDKVMEVVGAIGDAWGELDDSYDSIITATGAQGEALDDLNEQFDNLYTTMPVEANEVSNAIGELNTQFSFQGEELEKMSRYTLEFAKINGAQLTPSIQGAKKAIEQYHMSAKDLPAVLDAVNKAGQDTGVSTDKLFDSAIKGAPVFQDLGLSFEQSVAWLSQMEKNGVDTAQAISWLTKAQAKWAENGKKVGKADEEVSKAREKLNNLTEKGKKGTKEYAEAQNELKNAELNLMSAEIRNKMSFKDGINEFVKGTQVVTDKNEILNESLELFGTKGGRKMIEIAKAGGLNFDSMGKAAEGAKDSVVNTYNAILDPADQAIIAQNNFKEALASIGSTAQEIFAPAFEFIAKALKKLVDGFKSLPKGLQQAIVIIGAVAGALTVLASSFLIIKGAITTAKPLLLGLKGGFAGIGTALSGLFSFVAANPIVLIIAAIVAGVVLLIKHWDTVKKTTKDLWDNIKQAFEGIKTAISGAWDAVKAKTSEIWNGIKTEISNIWEGIKTGIGNSVEAVKTKVSGVWDEVKTKTLEIWNGIKTGISNIWEGIKTGVGGAVGAVKDKVTNIFSGLKDTVSKTWEGIKDAITKPIDKAKEIVGKIIEKIKGFFNFKIEWPHIPVPHFTIQPPGWKFGDLLKGSIPTLGIDWRDQGGIFYNPAIIGVGEKRPEFVGALDDLKAIVADVVKKENKDISGEAPVVIHIDSMVVRDDHDISKIANELAKYLKKEKRVRHA